MGLGESIRAGKEAIAMTSKVRICPLDRAIGQPNAHQNHACRAITDRSSCYRSAMLRAIRDHGSCYRGWAFGPESWNEHESGRAVALLTF